MEVIVLSRNDVQALIRDTVRVTVSELQTKGVPPIMNKAQVAAYLDKSIPTINRYMREGMPYRKIENGHPEFYKTEVDRWLNERIQEVPRETHYS